jgi:hypothetical protein
MQDKEREARVALMAERRAKGLDLWSGKPLPKPKAKSVAPKPAR